MTIDPKKLFLTPYEAAVMAGLSLHGPEWQPELLDGERCQSTTDVWRFLVDAVEAEAISAYVDNGNGERPLTPTDCRRLEFDIDARKGTVRLFDGPDGWFRCRFHRRELEACLRSVTRSAEEQPTSNVPSSGLARSKTRKWLVDHMLADTPGVTRKMKYFEQAKNLWPGLSVNAFNQVWKEAKVETGRADFAKPGRPLAK